MSRAIIFVNGPLADARQVRRLIQPGDTFIAADGGTRHALALGLKPSAVIGDLDSLDEETIKKLEKDGTRIMRFPADKNETDFELALKFAVEASFREILVVAALGGRLDQTLGNLALLTDPSLAGLDIRVEDGVEEAFFVRTRSRVEGSPGDIVSLIPWGGEAKGVSAQGLRWPLKGETLYPQKTRGISNELLGETASLSLESGLLLVVHTHHRKY